jgi:hypothetical protein
MDYLKDQELADLCRRFAAGELAMASILKIMHLPKDRAQQASYKLLSALRRIELAKKGVVLR